MVFGFILMNLVDGDGAVDNGWLDGLLVDHWLDVLVDVVVNVLADDSAADTLGVLCGIDVTGVLELSLLSCETLLDVVVVAVLDLAVLDTGHLVRVLLWEDLTVAHWLDRGVVVILVHLTVNGSVDILVAGWGDSLVLDCWVHSLEELAEILNGRLYNTYLVNSGVMLSILGEEVADCCLCLIHFD